MKYMDMLKLAFVGVSSNKFRSFLTLLGIIIGVGAVIIMVSLGSGTQQVVSGQFSSLFTRQIYLGPNWNLSYQQMGKLSLDDEIYLKQATVGVEVVAPFYRDYQKIKYAGKEIENTIAGVVSEAMRLTNLQLKYGRSIEESDLKNRERVAVVGENVLRKLVNLKDYSSLIGKEIDVNGVKLIIIGILSESSSSMMLPNDVVLIPTTTYRTLWRRKAERVDFYLVTYDETSSEEDIMAQINYLMDKKYGKVSGKSRFVIQGIQGQTDMMSKIIRVFTYVLGGIAAISLLVGGIGVMNIMLVTVKERTREIGIRLAIGATRQDIQRQFLMEAIILTVSGGLLGVIVGALFSFLINLTISHAFNWWQGNIPLWIIGLSFGVTVGIGLVFGFYPAYKASKLDPIEALSYK